MGEDTAHLTEAEYNTWLTPRAANLALAGLRDYIAFVNTLNEMVAAGEARVAVKSIQRFKLGRETVAEFVILDRVLWATDYRPTPGNDFWKTGHNAIHLNNQKITYFGARFEPKGVEEFKRAAGLAQDEAISAIASALAQQPPGSSKGGRPPAAWWDDLWVEMCRQLYVGDLKPIKQADIEKAMHDWLATFGKSAAEQTIRARARKLFEAIIREG